MKELYSLKNLLSVALLLSFVVVSGCKWSPEDFKTIEWLKEKSMELVENSKTATMSNHQNTINDINDKLQAIIDGKKPKIGVKMIEKVKNQNPWDGFLKLWSQGTLKTDVADDLKSQIEKSYNEVLDIGKKDN